MNSRVRKRVRLRDNNQMTIPQDIVAAAGLEVGQEFHMVYHRDGDIIELKPLAVVQKSEEHQEEGDGLVHMGNVPFSEVTCPKCLSLIGGH